MRHKTNNEVYEFKYGNVIERYTTTGKELIANDQGEEVTCMPAVLGRSKIVLSNEIRRSQVTIMAPSNFKIAEMFRCTTPSFVIRVALKLAVYPQYDIIPTLTDFWIGRVITVEWKHTGANIICESFYASIGDTTNNRYFCLSCPHALYGSLCGLNKENFKITGAFLNGTENQWNIGLTSNIPDGYFNGGFLSFFDSTIQGENLLRISQNINKTPTNPDFPYEHSIKLLQPPYIQPELLQPIFLYPGCDHTLNTCMNKFNNKLNFGGFPWIPLKNPFDTTSTIYW